MMPRTTRFAEEDSPKHQEKIQGCVTLFMLFYFPLLFLCTPVALALGMIMMGYGAIRYIYFVLIRDAFFVGNRKHQALNAALKPENTIDNIYHAQLKQIGAKTASEIQPQNTGKISSLYIPRDAFYGKPLKVTFPRRESVAIKEFTTRFLKPLVDYAILSSGRSDYYAVPAEGGGAYLVKGTTFRNGQTVKTYISWEIGADNHAVAIYAYRAYAYYSNSWLYDSDGSGDVFEDDLFAGVFEVVKDAYMQVTPLFHRMSVDEVFQQAKTYLETKSFAPVWNVAGASYSGAGQNSPNYGASSGSANSYGTSYPGGQPQNKTPGTPPIDGAEVRQASEGIKTY